MNALGSGQSYKENKSDRSRKILEIGKNVTKKSVKPVGVTLIASTLAACDMDDFFGRDNSSSSSNTNNPTTPTTTPTTPTSNALNFVNGATIDGAFYDGNGVDIVEFTGNTDPNVDAGEWVNVAQVVIRDANGDFTITDLQATDNDAATGNPGTTFKLDDTSQNALGTTTLNFDIQAVDTADTSVTIAMNEAAGNVVLNGGDIETVTIVIDDISPQDVTLLTSLDVQGIETLIFTGGEIGYLFTIEEPLNETISTIDASGALSALDIDISNALSSTYILGQGDDRMVMGNTLGSNDIIEGGTGRDLITTTFDSAQIVAPQMSGVEVMNAVFTTETTFQGVNVTGLEEINLGLSDTNTEVASTVDVDLDRISADLNTLNIHANHVDIEVDYQSGAQASLSINFMNDSGAVTIGDGLATDVELHNVRALEVNNVSANAATVRDSVDLNNATEILSISTMNETGTLDLAATDSAFLNGSALREITVSAVNGDIELGRPGGDFVDEVIELQNYTVIADDAMVDVADVGTSEAAIELETVNIQALNESAITHGEIFAHDGANRADIAEIRIVGSDQNILSGNNAAGSVSVYFEGLYAGDVSSQFIDATDGGDIELDNQMYQIDHQVFMGSGDITIAGGDAVGASSTGYVQSQAADASAHTGDRLFIASDTKDDVFYGSDKADDVQLSGTGNKTYNDAGGSDDVTISGTGTRTINDGSAGTNDEYTFAGSGSGFVFNAGSGNDEVTFVSGQNLADFGSWQSGVVELQSFTSGTDTLSFDGLTNITSSASNPLVAPAGLVTNLNANTTYVFADGDTAVGAFFVADYLDMTDVSNFLNAATMGSAGGNDSVVFVINNFNVTGATGDDKDAYIYHYQDDGSSSGIQASELTLIGTINTSGGSVVPSDVV